MPNPKKKTKKEAKGNSDKNRKEIEAIKRLKELDNQLNRTNMENALLPNPAEAEGSATDALESNLLDDLFIKSTNEHRAGNKTNKAQETKVSKKVSAAVKHNAKKHDAIEAHKSSKAKQSKASASANISKKASEKPKSKSNNKNKRLMEKPIAKKKARKSGKSK